jgi:hypothetical protein
MRRQKKSRQLRLIKDEKAKYLPSFASTEEEVKRAVERNAIARGALLIKVIISLKLDSILEIIRAISKSYDKEEIIQAANELNIDLAALRILDEANPPIAYPYYFCIPQWLVENPDLFFYYRNVAMLSTKVMNGIGLSTKAFEENSQIPDLDYASEIARYLNGIVSSLIEIGGVSVNRHLEMLLGNLGDSLGGIARNEVGRAASAQVIRYIALHFHRQNRLKKISYSLKGSVVDEEDDDRTPSQGGLLNITPDLELDKLLDGLERQRVKYRELTFDNGYSLLLDRQVKWEVGQKKNEVESQIVDEETLEQKDEEIIEDQGQKSYKIGVDFHTTSDNSYTMLWVAELKGGADPAGSDEHWKTATQALNRVINASKKTGRPVPLLSFIATILVERVAIEAQQWISTGRMKTVYNLTKIEENEQHKKEFLEDVEIFLGYKSE